MIHRSARFNGSSTVDGASALSGSLGPISTMIVNWFVRNILVLDLHYNFAKDTFLLALISHAVK